MIYRNTFRGLFETMILSFIVFLHTNCDPFSPLSYRHSASSPEGVLGLRPPHAGPDPRESPPLLQRGGPTADRTRSRPSV